MALRNWRTWAGAALFAAALNLIRSANPLGGGFDYYGAAGLLCAVGAGYCWARVPRSYMPNRFSGRLVKEDAQ